MTGHLNAYILCAFVFHLEHSPKSLSSLSQVQTVSHRPTFLMPWQKQGQLHPHRLYVLPRQAPRIPAPALRFPAGGRGEPGRPQRLTPPPHAHSGLHQHEHRRPSRISLPTGASELWSHLNAAELVSVVLLRTRVEDHSFPIPKFLFSLWRTPPLRWIFATCMA